MATATARAGIPASASASSASSATLFFLFIVFALLRAIFWRGGPGRRGWGPGGWGGYGYGKGPDGSGHGPWESHANQAFDEWHRRAHGETAPPEPNDQTKPTGTA